MTMNTLQKVIISLLQSKIRFRKGLDFATEQTGPDRVCLFDVTIK